ncbi:MAG: hypothetical protein WCR67_06060 [Bacilli bacterium]
MVTDIYNSDVTTTAIMEDQSYEVLNSVLSDAISWLWENQKDITWSDYDTNADGRLDSVHFIGNSGNVEWSTPLWPHMSQISSQAGTSDRPTVRTFMFSSTFFLSESFTSIHEQGHIFGLEDYYDYSYLTSPLGRADMQDETIFDWNSFSKMVTGWITPYVIDGKKDTTTLTINPASLSGDCILIPSPDSWNGSAYDEYILLELFTRCGNNDDFWDDYCQFRTLGFGGIRMYHVDARLWGFNDDMFDNGVIKEGEIVDDISDYEYENYFVGTNNSYNKIDYGGYIDALKNFNLIQIIQAGGENSFGAVELDGEYHRHSLTKEDLFETGDVFTMDDYSDFFYNKTTLDDGSEFPYTISFDSVTAESATITFSIER